MKDCANHTEYGPGPESIPGLPVWGPPDYWFPTGVTHSRPIGQARGASEATSAPGDHPSRIQNACREPYYQAVPTGESPPASAGDPAPIASLPPRGRGALGTSHPHLPILNLFLCLPSFHSSGTLTCTPQGPWKGTQDGEELPHCAPGE